MGWSGIKEYGFGSKNRTQEQDDEYRSRIKGVPKTITWTKEKCIEELNDILDLLKKTLKDDEKLDKNDPRKLKQETIRDSISLMNRILEYMKYLYPPVQQNVNYNIEVELDKVIEKWREKNTGITYVVQTGENVENN